MHSDPTELLQHIPKECVPSDLGGTDKTIKELGGTYIPICNTYYVYKFQIVMLLNLFIPKTP